MTHDQRDPHELRDQRDVSLTAGTGWTVALYVRDRLALPVEDHVPPLTPPVEPRPLPREETGALAAEWAEWWHALAGARTWAPVRPSTEALAAAFDELVDDALAWEEAAPRPNLDPSEEDLPVDPSSPATRLPGDPGIPVRLDIECLPVTGRWHRDAGPRHLLVSVETSDDLWEMRALLESRIARLQVEAVTVGPPAEPPAPRRMVVDDQVFTVRVREPGVYDFFWENGPIEGYGFTIGTSDRGPLADDALRQEIRGFAGTYEP
ncbi:hypothetical protein [Oerskovia turbata]